MSQVVGKDMIIGMGYIGLDPGRLYRMHRGPKLIDAVVTGTDITIKDAAEGRAFKGLRVFGRTDQKGTPSPETPQEMETAGKSGNLGVAVSDGADHSQSLTLSTPNGLPGIPVSSGGNYTDAKGQQWVCDEIDLGRGKYVQRVAAESISGGWKLVDTSDVPGRFIQNNRVSNAYANGGKTALCTIAAWTNYGVSKGDNRYVFAVSGTAFYISPPSDVSMTADELNAKLNALKDPVVILGQLAAPIERGLTPEEIAAYKALRTYIPTTVVSNDARVWMEVGYEAERKET